jgi:hypothetical protein
MSIPHWKKHATTAEVSAVQYAASIPLAHYKPKPPKMMHFITVCGCHVYYKYGQAFSCPMHGNKP